ncbi:hypothetical protein HMPREF0454_04116 [Hafnia alvei ATCC 51873]|uniref:Uncharacterized protein n=1 Tax=Hafnia alvei ATCC 51873 TaxID=1002364 RepID=G9YBZ1_HAFAL|nr:hypothetical protein HMPREF0454_04116 [Hafnia alvei ATCC 51873]
MLTSTEYLCNHCALKFITAPLNRLRLAQYHLFIGKLEDLVSLDYLAKEKCIPSE